MNKTLIKIALLIESIILINPVNVYSIERIDNKETKIINENINKSSSTQEKNNEESKVGWKIDKDGNTTLLDGKGNMVKSSWCQVGGEWYYFDGNGIMKKGWIKYEENWYHLNSNGIIETGWIFDNGKYYYCDSNGIMMQGWFKDSNNWYYLNQSGEMQIGWSYINGEWYYFAQNGTMQCNTEIDGYYLGSDGSLS